MRLVEAAFGILGATALRLDGVLDAEWESPKPKAMLAALLVAPGRTLPGEALARWVWSQEQPPPTRTTGALDTYATRIRKLLKRLPVTATLRGHRGTYRLDTDRAAIDYFQFRDLVATAQRHFRDGRSAEAAHYADLALRLSRGRPLDDLRSAGALAWRGRFERDELIPAHTTHLSALIDLGRADEALVLLDDLQSEHQESLALHKARLVTLHALDRAEEASEYYLHVYRQLRTEGDPQAADHLRRHYESLITRAHSAPWAAPKEYHPPRQLRFDVHDFVGRADQLSQLDTLALDDDGTPVRGVVVLEGMPGVGKTSLAVHWGHRRRTHFPDGDLFIDLHGYSGTPAATQASVIDELLLGLGEEPDAYATRARAAALRRTLANRHTLVVLDNARNSDHVRELLPLLAECLVVVTSRNSLTALGAKYNARRIQVKPMSEAESTSLLGTRLGADSDPGLRAEVVRLCGGLPLVIAVVGQNIAEYRLRRDHAGVAPRRLLLELGIDADGDNSPQTLFTWSYRALPQAPRRLFRLLGLHPGTEFSVAAAQACWGRDEAETGAALTTLVGSNLVERTDSLDRFRLHDLIGECAGNLATTDEPVELRHAAERRVLAFYLATATAAHHALYPDSDPGPPFELPTQVSPLDFADADAGRTWLAVEHSTLMNATAVAAAAGHHDLAWRLPHAMGVYLEQFGYHEDYQRALQTAVTSAGADGDEEAEAATLADLGRSHMTLGRLREAQQCLHQAMVFADKSGNQRGQCASRFSLGRIAILVGDTAAGVRLLGESLELARATDDTEAKRWTHYELGDALRLAGDLNKALLHLLEAQQHAAEAGDDYALALVLAGISAVSLAQGEHEKAASFGIEAMNAAEASRNAGAIVTTCTALAEVELATGAWSAAELLATRAVSLAERVHDVPVHARAAEVLGDVLAAQGRHAQARRTWLEADELYHRLGSTAGRHRVYTKIVDLSR
ncbi:tetratricopeptide (TPR) repeat protein [Actinokineospora baliensis]|uniref:BTAD domain-containing putative transcriptional regulator n=1 Tax=Actinokineospora baliensis TaxID=547056 RepID=UPI00195CC46E|nr:BTAD domain-containing putative transcriptional regulator [Actinokineospora baliensis]MBM7773110.1 tetratricopeptide (TPR) repeat protein [Actinokineospora baliensis]